MEDQEPLHVKFQGGSSGRREGAKGNAVCLEVWARSIRGKVRQENQDAWCVATPEGVWCGPGGRESPGRKGRKGLFVAGVFDGLGGHANGREAAQAAANALPDAVAWGTPVEDLVARLEDAVVSSGGMTTALVVLVELDAETLGSRAQASDAGGLRMRVLSVGDSAAFARDASGGLARLNELDRTGRHKVSDALGLKNPERKGRRGHEVRSLLGEGIVLTTDGVADEVLFEKEWGGLLGEPVAKAGERFHDLFAAVWNRGAPDNATTILVRPSGLL